MANPIQIKRTSVSGRAANTSTLTNPGELAINMTDGIMYSTNGSVVFEVGANLSSLAISGTPAINSSGYWVGPSLYAQQEDYIYSITTSTSVITGADDNSDVLSYTAGLESVFINGVRQIAGVDYATTNATAITLTDPVINNDVVQVINFEGSIEATNVDAQFVWTNTHTFSNTVTINDKLGIGTSSPDTSLHISESSTSTTTIRLEQTDTSLVTDQAVGVIEFEQNDAVGAGVPAKFGAFGEDANAAVGLRFYTGTGATANERMRINSSGNVGIGTASPLGLLEVANITEAASEDTQVWFTTRGTGSGSDVILNLVCENTTTGETFINFGDSAATDAGQLRYNHDGDIMQFRTATSERMRITSAGNVGIGTSSPTTSQLHVYTNTDNAYAAKFDQDHPTGWGVLIDTDATVNNDPALWVKNATDTIMWAGSGGNVGIGTTSPSNPLDIEASTATVDINMTNTANRAEISLQESGTTKGILQYRGSTNGTLPGTMRIGTQGSDDLIFNTAGAERMRVLGTGNVGIGTTSPSAKFHVADAVDGKILISGTSTSAELELSAPIPKITFTDTSSSAVDGEIKVDGNAMQFGMGGSERMRITSGGALAVGTTNPLTNAQTHFQKNVNADFTSTLTAASSPMQLVLRDISNTTTYPDCYSGLFFGAGATGAHWQYIVGARNNGLVFGTGTGSAPVQRMVIDTSGNVGIGTAAPLRPLSAANTSAEAQIFAGRTTTNGNLGNTAAGGRISFGSTSTATGVGYEGARITMAAAQTWTVGSAQGASLIFETTANSSTTLTERMRIDSSGQVGIGNTSPGYRLDVTAGDTTAGLGYGIRLRANVTANGGTFQFTDNGATTQWAYITGNTSEFRLAADSRPLTFHVNGERARIDTSGNLLVGTTSALSSSKFALVGGLNTYNMLVIKNTDAQSGGQLFQLFLNSAGDTAGSIGHSGTTAVSYNTSSDYRLKDIDGPVTNSGVYIDALKPVQGSWKADGSRFIGLLAHEVQEVSETQIATGEKDGKEMQAMDYSSPELIANLIAEIQSLRARVAQLEGNT